MCGRAAGGGSWRRRCPSRDRDSGYVTWVGLATDPGRLDELWTSPFRKAPVPEVDFDEDVVVWFGVVSGACTDVELGDVTVDGAVVHADIVESSRESGPCPLVAVYHFYVVALERSRLPSGPFTVELRVKSPGHTATRRLAVDVDLSGPGAVAGPGAVRSDRDLPG